MTGVGWRQSIFVRRLGSIILSGTLKGFPNPPAMRVAGRSPSTLDASYGFILSGTLGGFPGPPAMSAVGRSPPALDAIEGRVDRRGAGFREPWEGSRTLHIRNRSYGAMSIVARPVFGNPGRVPGPSPTSIVPRTEPGGVTGPLY